jgi:thioredoxin 1
MTNDTKDKGDACGCGGGSCCGRSGKWIWIALAAGVVGVLLARNAGKKDVSSSAATGREPPAAVKAAGAMPAAPATATQEKALPRLVDLGATKCVPCKLMAPILEELKKTYAGKLDVQFIDVWENEDAGKTYGINLIPTQIFYGADGKELFRHEGFLAKDDILAKWKEFGVDLPQNQQGGNPGD